MEGASKPAGPGCEAGFSSMIRIQTEPAWEDDKEPPPVRAFAAVAPESAPASSAPAAVEKKGDAKRPSAGKRPGRAWRPARRGNHPHSETGSNRCENPTRSGGRRPSNDPLASRPSPECQPPKGRRRAIPTGSDWPAFQRRSAHCLLRLAEPTDQWPRPPDPPKSPTRPASNPVFQNADRRRQAGQARRARRAARVS